MQFLADENCDSSVVVALRQEGHDVSWVAETQAGATDLSILAKAKQSGRIIITEDRDFCELVFRDSLPTSGIILIRIPSDQRSEKAQRMLELLEIYADELANAMSTVTTARFRIRPLSENT